MTDLDALIGDIAIQESLKEGTPAGIVSARNGNLRPAAVSNKIRTRPPRWTFEEKAFLRSQIGKMTDAEIGAALGRSEAAIKIKRQRWGFPAHSKRPGWVTGHGASKILGVDIHSIMALTDRGLLPHVVIPGERGILNVKKMTLYRWALNTANWIYFKHRNVRDRKLRRLLALKRERWEDEWWTPGQVAEYHGVHHTDVNRYILAGKISSVKWGNNWILRSEATKEGLYFYKGKGAAMLDWSDDGDAFMVLGRAVGFSCNALNAMAKFPVPRADVRLRRLMEHGEIQDLVDKYDLEVSYDPDRQLLWADWHRHRDRFPSLGRAIAKFEARERLSQKEIYIVRGVLAAWLAWFDIDHPAMVSSTWSYPVIDARLRKMAAAIKNIYIQGD